MRNPYQNSSWLNTDLSLEICQRLYLAAAHRQSYHKIDDNESRVLPELSELARYYGPEIFILHPADAARIFAGVTLPVYQTIHELFCSPLRRSSRTVWHILAALAQEADTTVPSRDAIWAICEHMRAARDREHEPTIERLDEWWFIVLIQPDVRVRFATNTQRPRLVCVIAGEPERVLAFRVISVDETEQQASRLTLYDAIVGQRWPDPQGHRGIQWHLPRAIESVITLPDEVIACCQELHVDIAPANRLSKLLSDLHGGWTRSLAGRTIDAERFELILDNYLEKRHSYGPVIAREDRDYAFRHLTGYNRDPALLMPALRHLLLAYDTPVGIDGRVSYDGYLYHDDLLKYWRCQPVTLRRSLHDPTIAYVYFDGEILCQIIAQEIN